MSIRKLTLASAAAALAFAPVAAQAAPARAAAPAAEASEMGGEGTPTFALIAALIIVALAILVATDDGDSPTSP